MDRKKIVREIQREFCKRCEKESGKKNIDMCFECPWHERFNQLYNSFNGEK